MKINISEFSSGELLNHYVFQLANSAATGLRTLLGFESDLREMANEWAFESDSPAVSLDIENGSLKIVFDHEEYIETRIYSVKPE